MPESIPPEIRKYIQENPELTLLALLSNGDMWCDNCSNRRCMDCVMRTPHDACDDSCPMCCEEPRGGPGGIVMPSPFGPVFESGVLPQGWYATRLKGQIAAYRGPQDEGSD